MIDISFLINKRKYKGMKMRSWKERKKERKKINKEIFEYMNKCKSFKSAHYK